MNNEFDTHARNYKMLHDQSVKLTGEDSEFFAEYKAQKILEWLPSFRDLNCNILEFGCGIGSLTEQIRKNFKKARIIGIDSSQESIKIAAKRYQGIEFYASEGAINFPDELFDIIVAACVFHHIPFHEHAYYMHEIFRVLKKGGVFVLLELNPLNPGTLYIVNRSPIDKNALLLSSTYAQSLVKSYGKCRINYYCFFPGFLRKLRSIEHYMTKIPLGGHYACLVQK